MDRNLVAAAIVSFLLLGCSSGDSAGPPQGKASRIERSKGSEKGRDIKERKPTGPKRAQIINIARGKAARLTRRAISDLKGMGYWDDLTKKIFAVRISSRERSVPLDRHLADSLWTYYRDEETGELGDLCDVLMFTKAVKDDVARQEAFYAQGRLADPAPSVAQFWTVLLAHEIAHCSDRGQKGERYSTRWESRILAGYGIDRIGTP